MTRRPSIPVVIALALLAAAVISGALYLLFPGEGAQVRRVIRDVAAAAEKRSADGVLVHFAPEFRDSLRGAPFEVVSAQVTEFFAYLVELRCDMGKIKVRIDGQRATAAFDATVMIKLRGSMERTSLFRTEGPGHFGVQFEQRDGRWLIVACQRPRLFFE